MQSDNPPDEPIRACIKGSMRVVFVFMAQAVERDIGSGVDRPETGLPGKRGEAVVECLE